MSLSDDEVERIVSAVETHQSLGNRLALVRKYLVVVRLFGGVVAFRHCCAVVGRVRI